MRASTGRAPAEIKPLHAIRNRSLHERPVEKHVRSFAAVLAQRRRPGHFEFIAETKTAAAGDGVAVQIRTSEPAIVRELPRDLARPPDGLRARKAERLDACERPLSPSRRGGDTGILIGVQRRAGRPALSCQVRRAGGCSHVSRGKLSGIASFPEKCSPGAVCEHRVRRGSAKVLIPAS